MMKEKVDHVRVFEVYANHLYLQMRGGNISGARFIEITTSTRKAMKL